MKTRYEISSNAVAILPAVLMVLLTACTLDVKDPCAALPCSDNPEQEIQEALITLEDGGKVTLAEGVFEFTRTLTMDDKSMVTIQGKGRDKTFLSFKNQVSGGDGMLITNSENIVVRDLTILDTTGDALKVKDSQGIVLYQLGAEWSGEPNANNGAYGLYPVNSRDILIDGCYAYGASDSGIYVGQSDNAIVRNSTATGNVAGIEIENTTNADVYGNTVTDNAAGILIFDLPGLSQYGARTRVFNNTITNNIRGNFAPSGNIVAEVPAGTGILVLSTSEVEIFGNTITENNVMGTTVGSYAALVSLGLRGPIQNPNYNPFPGSIFIHGNTYSRSNTYPDAQDQSTFGNLLVGSFGTNPIPDILLDGIFAPGTEPSGTICIGDDNMNHAFVNLNLAADFPNNLSFDLQPHACSLPPLPAVELNIPDF